jgi:AI-2 transport protein TqsA
MAFPSPDLLRSALMSVGIIRFVQDVAGPLRSFAGFFLLVVILTLIGLLEVDEFKRRLQTIDDRAKGRTLLQIAQAIAVKFRKYMFVRSLASVLTGALIFVFTSFAGLELATAWGIMAFTLNYIRLSGRSLRPFFPRCLLSFSSSLGKWRR